MAPTEGHVLDDGVVWVCMAPGVVQQQASSVTSASRTQSVSQHVIAVTTLPFILMLGIVTTISKMLSAWKDENSRPKN